MQMQMQSTSWSSPRQTSLSKRVKPLEQQTNDMNGREQVKKYRGENQGVCMFREGESMNKTQMWSKTDTSGKANKS